MSNPVLIVDDEPTICWALEKALQGEGHETISASSAEEGLRFAQQQPISLVMLDVRLPGKSGLEMLSEFTSVTGGTPVVIMTAFGDLDTAVAAVKNGASDYITKPFKLDDVLHVCKRAMRTPSAPTDRESVPSVEPRDAVLVGGSPAMQQVFKQIALVAASDLSVLITGETGTGKELVAAAIAKHSPRAQQPYIAIAPVALNRELIESEMFGHVAGAFTGATHDRAGLFERADGGTVLLDEIGDLPMNLQVKLLRVLEQGEFSRVGEVRVRKTDVRVIAATNCDLASAVAAGSFREDLFHRLNGMRIHLPPLRDRADDIEPLCQYFIAESDSPNANQPLDTELIDELKRRPWYGNVRELRNATRHAAVVARARPLSIEDFPPPQQGRLSGAVSDQAQLSDAVEAWTRQRLAESETPTLHDDFLAAVEPSLLKVVMEHTSGNRAKAAERLGIHRGTLRDRLRAYGMDS